MGGGSETLGDVQGEGMVGEQTPPPKKVCSLHFYVNQYVPLTTGMCVPALYLCTGSNHGVVCFLGGE